VIPYCRLILSRITVELPMLLSVMLKCSQIETILRLPRLVSRKKIFKTYYLSIFPFLFSHPVAPYVVYLFF
jgi:hypothetical protein